MPLLTRIALDVLKPHIPNALEFANAISENSPGCKITVTVIEVDEKTETTMVTIEGDNIDYDKIVNSVTTLGGSIHSIDEVTVSNFIQEAE
ncbi:MAG: hypothetical protein AMJ53_05980 [Gammaproteobacteria bacterium SG8_11]|nr:MAG: hypothetical protein AMJ53_05980 [Gammaproteobacteria bacterium SG8_11]